MQVVNKTLLAALRGVLGNCPTHVGDVQEFAQGKRSILFANGQALRRDESLTNKQG